MLNYEFNYALIDETGWCYEVTSTSRSHEGEEGWIAISEFNEDYLEKYYDVNTGKWFNDPEFTDEAVELN